MSKDLIDYFIQETNNKFDKLENDLTDHKTEIMSELTSIKKDTKKTLEFRWKIGGALIGISSVLTVLINIIALYVKTK